MKIFLAVFAVLLLASTPSWAVLGEYESSVSLDQQHLHAQVRQVTRAGYTVKELTAAHGEVVKEFVSPKGMVFGVSWHGPAVPDLRQWLGSYFPQVQQAAQSRKQRGGPLLIKTDKLVLVSGGHMRWHIGYAYAPNLVPSNVSPEVLQ